MYACMCVRIYVLNWIPPDILTWLYSFRLFLAEKDLQCRLRCYQGVLQSAFKLWPCSERWLLFHVSQDVVWQRCSRPLWDNGSFWWVHLFWILRWSDDGNVKTKCSILWNASCYVTILSIRVFIYLFFINTNSRAASMWAALFTYFPSKYVFTWGIKTL